VRVDPSLGPDPFREKAIGAARADPDAAAEALVALFRGDDSYEADAGAALLAEALDCLRQIAGQR
jgi:hypothetical protein